MSISIVLIRYAFINNYQLVIKELIELNHELTNFIIINFPVANSPTTKHKSLQLKN